ncbi:MAG: MATE family efflux transporter [Oscillospiraceae bacterium]|jgi:putative MATE family efflux protein|nr:MATE family efflux transporter [Oscillospiraceae bacterium]
MMQKIKSLFGSQDMTEGSIPVGLLKFSIPLLIGSIAQMLYTAADRMIVGRFIEGFAENGDKLSDIALGAVGVSMPILNIFLVLFMAIGGGVMTMVSQYYGAKDKENLGLTIGNSITLVALSCVLVTAVATPLTGPMLKLLNTNAQPLMERMAYDYLFILFLGTTGGGFYNVFSGVLRGLGDSVFPLLVLLGTVALNIVLDILCVAPWGLNMGVAGAAWATIVSQILSAIACMIRILRPKGAYSITRQSLRLHSATVRQIARLGIPSGIQMAIMFVSNLIVQPFLMDMSAMVMDPLKNDWIQMGSLALPSLTATQSVDGFALMPSQAFSMAAGTFTGQNIGAGRMDRVKSGSKTVFFMCLGFSVVMVTAMQIFGRSMFRLFTDTELLVSLCRYYILIMIPAYLIMTVNMTYQGVMRGAGDAVGTMWISILINVIFKLPLTLLIIHLTKGTTLNLKVNGVDTPVVWPNGSPASMFYAMLICVFIGMFMTLVYYRRGSWKTKYVVKRENVDLN